MSDLEKKFHEDMMNIYFTAKKELKYNATRFLQLVTNVGGLKAAKQLIRKNESTYGFEVLWESKRLDLSDEALGQDSSTWYQNGKLFLVGAGSVDMKELTEWIDSIFRGRTSYLKRKTKNSLMIFIKKSSRGKVE